MKKMTLTALSLVVALAASTAFATDAAKPPLPPKGGEHHGAPAHHMFKDADTNNDGVISKDEWTASGEKMFDKMDANHDGKITKEEMKAHHEKMRAKMEKRWEHKDENSDRPVTPTGILRN